MDLHYVLLAVLILLSVVALSVTLFKRLGLGSVLGLLAAGTIVGPSGLAVATRVNELRQFSEMGVVLLLFLIGLEMQPAKLWHLRRAVFGLGFLQVVLTGAVLTVYIGISLHSWNVAVLVGLGLALSSTAFVMQLLEERGILTTAHGQNAFAILLFQDLAIVPLLALVPILSDQAAAGVAGTPVWQKVMPVAAMLAAVLGFGRFVLPAVLDMLARQRNREAFTIVVMVGVIGAAWAMEEVGLSMALGAFLMGTLLSASRYRYQVEAAVMPFKWLFLSLFFLSVGMSIDVAQLPLAGPRVVLDLVAIIILKAVVLLGLCIAFGLGRATAVRLALLLPQCGEFGFVLFGAAAAAGLMAEETFAYSTLVISLTMIATPLLAKLGDSLAERLGEGAALPAAAQPGVELERHVVVVGYGRVGRTVAIVLERSGVPYVAFDVQPERVRLGKHEKRPVYFGDAHDPELLASGGAANAAAIVVTVHDEQAAERVVTAIRSFRPELPVVTRVRDLRARDQMRSLGVAAAIPDTAEASLQLGEVVLRSVGVADEDARATVQAVRADDYAAIRLPETAGRQSSRVR